MQEAALGAVMVVETMEVAIVADITVEAVDTMVAAFGGGGHLGR
jgi:hypothetical protein